jgi:hypothetical protein
MNRAMSSPGGCRLDFGEGRGLSPSREQLEFLIANEGIGIRGFYSNCHIKDDSSGDILLTDGRYLKLDGSLA